MDIQEYAYKLRVTHKVVQWWDATGPDAPQLWGIHTQFTRALDALRRHQMLGPAMAVTHGRVSDEEAGALERAFQAVAVLRREHPALYEETLAEILENAWLENIERFVGRIRLEWRASTDEILAREETKLRQTRGNFIARAASIATAYTARRDAHVRAIERNVAETAAYLSHLKKHHEVFVRRMQTLHNIHSAGGTITPLTPLPPVAPYGNTEAENPDKFRKYAESVVAAFNALHEEMKGAIMRAPDPEFPLVMTEIANELEKDVGDPRSITEGAPPGAEGRAAAILAHMLSSKIPARDFALARRSIHGDLVRAATGATKYTERRAAYFDNVKVRAVLWSAELREAARTDASRVEDYARDAVQYALTAQRMTRMVMLNEENTLATAVRMFAAPHDGPALDLEPIRVYADPPRAPKEMILADELLCVDNGPK